MHTHVVLCNAIIENVELKFEEWRRAMEERGLKSSRKKTEYLGGQLTSIRRYPFTGRVSKDSEVKGLGSR